MSISAMLCPKCSGTQITTERRIDGDSKCIECNHVDKTSKFWAIQPLTSGTLTACEHMNDLVFSGKDNKPVLKLSYDGKIEVFGDHDEAVQAFLSKLGEVYGGLPARLKEAEEKVKSLERQLKEGTEDGSRCNRRCDGVMVLGQPENCSCHLSAPCGACEDMRPECSMCGEVVE